MSLKIENESVISQLKWKCYKSIEQIDKYHDVDLIAWDKDDNLIFIQVKSLAMINKLKPSPKAINFASLHNAILYYFFVGRENQKIYVKRIRW